MPSRDCGIVGSCLGCKAQGHVSESVHTCICACIRCHCGSAHQRDEGGGSRDSFCQNNKNVVLAGPACPSLQESPYETTESPSAVPVDSPWEIQPQTRTTRQGGRTFAWGRSFTGGYPPAICRDGQDLLSSHLPQAAPAAADLTHRVQGSPGYPQEPGGKRAFGVGAEICRVIRNSSSLPAVALHSGWGWGERMGM